MDNLAEDIIALLQYLLPGFLSAWIFYGLTSFEKPGQFERIIQALIFTLMIQLSVWIILGILVSTNSDHNWWVIRRDQIVLIASIMVATIIGLVAAYFANTDKLHWLVRKCGISKETSYPSEWFGAFLTKKTYVVLHLKDGRAIYGWPKEWPPSPHKGHFLLEQALWIQQGEQGVDQESRESLSSILLWAQDIQMVEFIERV